ncbi:MAG: TAT-variant-translocated molybdopterin oxidoreductase, partial [Verrucomicrobiota bacterium]
MSSNQTNSTPATNGRRYWRSLDELSDTPEFKEWLHREFPQGASDELDGPNRRHFLKIMAASFAFAGVATLGAGCRRPEEKLEPFGQQPANYIYGKPEFYATAMPTRTGAVPLIAKSYEGRPVKVEGNALYPGSNGGTDRYAQASILDLYDVDRAKQFTKRGADGKQEPVSRDEALSFLNDLSKKFTANQGEGLSFLAESSTSPSRARLQKIIAQKFPKAQWFTYDAIDSGIHQRAATQAFGQPVKPVFHFDKAKVVLSLDCDFLGSEDDGHNHIARFAKGRKVENGGMSRLYTVESLFTLTGANADHRLRLAAGSVRDIAAGVLSLLIQDSMGDKISTAIPKPTSTTSLWFLECAKDLLANRGNVLVVAGQRQPIEVHLLAHAINTALDSIGTTVTLLPTAESGAKTMAEMLAADKANEIKTLVVLGGNPL